MEIPLNAWLLDFFKHGDVNTLEKANGIRKADIWFLLNDFSLALATIITSLLNFMKLREGTDVDMLDVMGNLDATEEAEDTRVADVEESFTRESDRYRRLRIRAQGAVATFFPGINLIAELHVYRFVSRRNYSG